MKNTMELLDRAIEQTGLSERALSERIGLSTSNLSVARNRGSLSPVAAGQLAELMGLDVEHWMATAVLETQPRSRITDQLRRAIARAAAAAGIPA